MSKKSKSSGLKSIRGGKDGGGYGVSNGNGQDHTPENTTVPESTAEEPQRETPFGASKVIDFAQVRAQRNLDNRRNFERHFLQHIVDVYCETGKEGEMVPVEIVEVSESGCSFRISTESSKLLPRDTTGTLLPLPLRLYMSRDSYMRIGLFVINSTRDIAGGIQSIRFGCRVDNTFASSEAYRQFVRFMEQFARHAQRDSKKASGL
jgi:hypothetical protein